MVPSRPVGLPVQTDGRVWAREGDSLVPMSMERQREIFAESGHDFSADICRTATLDDLDRDAIEDFRRRWVAKSGNSSIGTVQVSQLLHDAELMVDDRPTYAALILFGTHRALGKLLGQAEVVFEYRSSEASGAAQERREYRAGFFTFYDALWNDINKRNDLQHYREGLFVLDILTFDERSVREAVLNAVSHRNYQLAGNVFIRQYPRRLVIESPGGLPVGITTENILDRQMPRNRRLAESFQRCGLIERSGQGMNLMFERSLRQGKRYPDLTGTDQHQVTLTLHGEVREPRFIRFLERVTEETRESFNAHDLVLLDLIRCERHIPLDQRDRLRRMRDLGVVESVGRGRGTRYLLSRRFYAALDRPGTYTRRRGLDNEESKALLVKHLRSCGPGGAPVSELEEVLPARSRRQIRRLLRELRKEGRVIILGERRWTRYRLADDV